MRTMKTPVKRITVKVGSNVLTRPGGKLDVTRMSALVDQVAALRERGIEVILVSSGAVASGRSLITPAGGLDDVDSRQLFSAIGQARLMGRYYDMFKDHDLLVGQVLTMKESFSDPEHYANQRNCMRVMLREGVIPIVNENDSVATYEYSVGDNDNLSAMVASLVHADLLILLSDIDGLYTDDPRTSSAAKFIDYVPHMNEAILKMGKGSTGSSCGTGGMSTKLSAARIATDSGCDMAILNAAEIGGIRRLIAGENVGTLFRAEPDDRFDLEEYIEEMDYSG